MGQPNMNPPDFQTLKDKQRRLRDGFPQDLSLRVHRAISWVKRAEEELKKEDKDFDAQFIFLWIGFNAAYARNPDAAANEQDTEARKEFRNYFRTLIEFDDKNRIYDAVWKKFHSKTIPGLLNNKFVFSPFWESFHGRPNKGWRSILIYGNREKDWRSLLAKGKREYRRAQHEMDTPTMLRIVFDRLYVLRNQLMHGGATWDGDVNRKQVSDGAEILGWLLPIFVDLMMDNPHENWGPPWYPVIEK